jgi:hypothetical protein
MVNRSQSVVLAHCREGANRLNRENTCGPFAVIAIRENIFASSIGLDVRADVMRDLTGDRFLEPKETQ